MMTIKVFMLTLVSLCYFKMVDSDTESSLKYNLIYNV